MNAKDASFETGPDSSAFRRFDWRTVRAPVRARACAVLALGVVLFNGCASVPKDYPRTPSVTFPDYASTAVGAYLEKAAAGHPGPIGVRDLPRRTPRVYVADCDDRAGGKDAGFAVFHLGPGCHRADPGRAPGSRRGSRRPCTHPGRRSEPRRATATSSSRRWMRTRTSKSASSIPLPIARGSCWGSSPTSVASTTACTTSCSSWTTRSRSSVAATSAITISTCIRQVNFRDLDVIAGGPVVREASARVRSLLEWSLVGTDHGAGEAARDRGRSASGDENPARTARQGTLSVSAR